MFSLFTLFTHILSHWLIHDCYWIKLYIQCVKANTCRRWIWNLDFKINITLFLTILQTACQISNISSRMRYVFFIYLRIIFGWCVENLRAVPHLITFEESQKLEKRKSASAAIFMTINNNMLRRVLRPLIMYFFMQCFKGIIIIIVGSLWLSIQEWLIFNV